MQRYGPCQKQQLLRDGSSREQAGHCTSTADIDIISVWYVREGQKKTKNRVTLLSGCHKEYHVPPFPCSLVVGVRFLKVLLHQLAGMKLVVSASPGRRFLCAEKSVFKHKC